MCINKSQTMRDILKRKFAEVDDNPYSSSSSSSSSSSPPSSSSSPASSEWESDGESVSSDSQDFTPHSPSASTSAPNGSPTVRSILKRSKVTGAPGSVRFDHVTVFSFPRCQGFSSVPSRGGATLGMLQRHCSLRRFTVAEHALERRRECRDRLRERRRRHRLEELKHKLVSSGAVHRSEADRMTVDQVPEVQVSEAELEAELEDGGFLQPFSSRQRMAMLQAAGVKRVEREEKRQLQALRLSREACGCDCRGFCEPETCTCSLAGIKCQVDRFNFPCGCSADGCGNTEGRTEFNARRVQTHYIHTLMKLELERRLQDETLSQTRPPEDPQEDQDQVGVRPAQAQICPFGFTPEEDGLPLTVTAVPSFHFSPEQLMAEENSCSSDMTESSCSSSDSSDGGGGRLNGSQNGPDVNGGFGISEHKNCSQQRLMGEPQQGVNSAPTDQTGSLTTDTFTDTLSRASLTDFLDENANQARDFLEDDSLDGFPSALSHSVDYFSGRYMDLSLSSDSDIEFFDSDYTSGPLHSSFKLHRHTDGLLHLQLSSPVSLPQYESSTFLLESLIGLVEPGPEQDNAQLL